MGKLSQTETQFLFNNNKNLKHVYNEHYVPF